MECLVVIEPKSNSRHYDRGVAQFDRAQNSSSKMPMLAIYLCCVIGEKHLTLSSQLAAVQLSSYECKLAIARLSTLSSIF